MKPPSSFIAITSEGGLLPADFLHELPDPKTSIEGLTPVAYHLAEGERLNEHINRSWNRLKGCWENFKKAIAVKQSGEPTTTDTRERWLLPLFQELGFGRVTTAKPIEIEGRSYHVSHGWNQVPIHLVGSHADLDHRTPGAVGAAKASPHSLVQSTLNASEDHLWGILSNGLNLRLLRDNIALTRMAYVEFDLQAMFDGDLYSEFFVLWLVCHQSRFEGEKPAQFWLERWKKAAEDKTLRALDELYPGVKKAIAALGTGLVSNPANTALREKLRTGRLTTQEFYRQVLRVIYRMLFLLVAEDRALLHVQDDNEAALKARRRYRDFYSIARLRALTLYRAGTPHPDLWQVFQFVTARLGGDTGCTELALPPLGSFLWMASQSTPDLLDSIISNRHFLEAVQAIAFVQDGNVRRAVDYKNLGSEELGSVYQGLLEMHPRINADTGLFELDIAAGNDRKTSGSYYTPDSLVQCLLDSALEPVIAERLGKAKTPKEKETALLSLKVCDMAAGSGHFILRAAHRIAHHLASVRSGEEEPSPRVYQTALRDVIGHCLYGVDINPMAVELCKVTLWLEALEPGKPLSFLDHHIRCGNSLLGATPELIKGGIPDEAYEAIEGDDKEACSALKKKNKRENPKLGEWFIADEAAIRDRLHQAATAIDEMSDGPPEDIRRKETAFRAAQANYDFQKAWDLANLWCASFVIQKHFIGGLRIPTSPASSTVDDNISTVQDGLFGGTEEAPKVKAKKTKAPSRTGSELPFGITTQSLRDFVENGGLPDRLLAEAKRLANQYKFFHLHIAFPEVFAQGGFDVSLGNPPWERVKLQEKEWFAERRPDIASAPTAAVRKRKIVALSNEDPILYALFADAMRQAEGESHLMRRSGLYPLCGRGDINLYACFAERMRNSLNSGGRVGCVLPTGIATDDSNKNFIQHLVSSKSVCSFFDFTNRGYLFPGTESTTSFCLFTFSASPQSTFRVAAQLWQVEDLEKEGHAYTLTQDDILRINPNTANLPIFHSAKDAALNKAIYEYVPILFNEATASLNPWAISFMRMFDMTNDSDWFRTRRQLIENGFLANGSRFCTEDKAYLPLYEAKLATMFNHRAATFEGLQESDIYGTRAATVRPTESELTNPIWTAIPRYWIPKDELSFRTPDTWRFSWFIGFRNAISAVADARTVTFTIFPKWGAGNSIPVLLPITTAASASLLVANFNAFVLDYTAKQKASGGNLNFYIVKQLPLLPPSCYLTPAPWGDGTQSLIDWLLPRVLELTYTAWDLEEFAQDCGWSGPPFRWDEERRFLLRCEVDAVFFHLYLGTEAKWRQQPAVLTQAFPAPRAAVSYIMDTFPIVKRKDEAKWGEYRTQRVILEVYDALAEAIQAGKAYQTQLNPAPGSIMVAHPPRFERERVNFQEPGDYILAFVGSLLRHLGGECDLMNLIRAYAMLLGDRATLSTVSEARFGAEAGAWVRRFNQNVDASWFLPILRGLDNRDVLKLEERGESDVFARLLDTSVPSNSTVETDVYLILHVLDLNVVPPAAVLEQMKRIASKPIRTSLQEATPVMV